MAKIPPTPPKSKHIGTPNPQAMSAVLDRYYLWLAKEQLAKRAKKLKGRNRAASIKI